MDVHLLFMKFFWGVFGAGFQLSLFLMAGG
jgi:hypothetical protein